MSEAGKDSLLINKIMAGILTAGLAFWAANRIANIVVPDDAPKTAAIKIIGLQTAAAPTAAAGLASIIPLLGGADIAKGLAFVQQQCSSCHAVAPGGPNGIGPDLYNVMGGAMFLVPGYSFSDAAKSKAKGNWNYDTMNAWLAAPQSFAPGTTMSYSGIKNTQTRADVVDYLRTIAANPLPLPSPADVKAASATPSSPPEQAAGAAPAGAAPGGAPAAPPGIDTLFASADLNKGNAVVQQQCTSCHSVTKGGAAGVGPNIYGIVGAKMFSQAGFSYSDAAKGKAGGVWTPDTLSDWLTDPQHFASGTLMAFAGIKNDQTRADVIAWLNKNSDKPVALPGVK